MSDLDVLCQSPVTVTVAGEAIEVRELTVAQLPGFLRAAAPVLNVMSHERGFDLQAVMLQAESIIEAVKVATGLDPEWLSVRSASELLVLISAVVEANSGFFAQALPTFVAGLTARMRPLAG